MTTQRRAQQDGGGNTTPADARSNLLSATRTLLHQGGSHACTSRAIAEQAGENLASITYYFGSKDSLVHLALVNEATSLIEPAIEALQSNSDPVAKLAATTEILRSVLTDNRDKLSGYVQALAYATHEPDVAQRVQHLLMTITTVLTTELATQRDAGTIPEWVEPNGMAQLLVAVANGAAIAEALSPQPDRPSAAMSSQLAQLLMASR